MKQFFTLVFLFIGLISMGQISFDKDTTYGEGAASDFEIPAKAHVTNSGNDTTFRIIRYSYSNCDFTGTAFCDQNLCYPETTDSTDVIIRKDESFEMKVNFYPGGNAGCCQVKMYLISLTDANDRDSCVYNVSTTGFNCKIGINDHKKPIYNPSIIYPNPATASIQVDSKNQKPFRVDIYDILGNKVHTAEQVMNHDKINVTELPNGIYVIQVLGEYLSSSTFRKI